jgi:hypothetical protein
MLRTRRWERAELLAHHLFGDDVPRALARLAIELHEVDSEEYARVLRKATSGAGDWAVADVVDELVEVGLREDVERLADAMDEGRDKRRALRRIHPPPANAEPPEGQFFWHLQLNSTYARLGIAELVERPRESTTCERAITSFATALASYSMARDQPSQASPGAYRRALDDLLAVPECWPLAAELCSAVRDDPVQLLGWTLLATSALPRNPAMSVKYLESVRSCADRAAGSLDLVIARALTTLAQSVLDHSKSLDQPHQVAIALVASVLTSSEWQEALPAAQRLDDATVPVIVEEILREANRHPMTSDVTP